jgi:outer membrane protein
MRLLLASLAILGASAGAAAQEPPPPPAAGAQALVQDGRLRLTLEDAVRLAIASDAVRLRRLEYESAQLNVDRTAGGLFDPRLSASFSSTDSTQRTTVVQEGALRRTDTTQAGSFSFSQRLPSGTQSALTVGGNRFSTNNQFAIVNPQFNSSFRFDVRQPLWRNRFGFADRASLRRARYDSDAARATLAAELAVSVERAVGTYWAAVLASEGLSVKAKSLDLANATFNKNKRMLELGALAPLEIHRSEADVASRKLEVLRAEFDMRRRQEELRRELGIDLDPALARLPLELVDEPEMGDAGPPDVEAVVDAALRARPELHALERRLESRDAQVRVAQSAARPGVDLVASYALSGVGGTEFDPGTSNIVRVSNLGGAFDQISDRQFPVYSLSLVIDLPVRNRSNRANLATARIDRERGRIELQERRQEIALEVRQAADEVAHTLRATTLATIARDLSQKTLESEQRKYELGAAELFFVLDAQAKLAQAELSLLSAKVDYQRARTGLDLASGRLLEKHKVAID